MGQSPGLAAGRWASRPGFRTSAWPPAPGPLPGTTPPPKHATTAPLALPAVPAPRTLSLSAQATYLRYWSVRKAAGCRRTQVPTPSITVARMSSAQSLQGRRTHEHSTAQRQAGLGSDRQALRQAGWRAAHGCLQAQAARARLPSPPPSTRPPAWDPPT